MAKAITVFGSGTVKENSKNWEEAYQIGFLLAKAGFVIINGGYGGSMAASAMGAKKAGGNTVGITTDQFQGSVKNGFIDQEIRKRTYIERLHELVHSGDGFVILNGGTGTLVELMVVWEMNNKGLHAKPFAVLGRKIQAAVNAIKRNSEVEMSNQLYFAKDPKTAVQYLKRCLIS